MNSLDIVILSVIGFFAVKGIFRGIIIEIFTLGSIVLGYLISIREMSLMADVLKHYLHIPDVLSNVLGFAVVFTITVFIFRWIGLSLKKFAKWSFLGWVDKSGGVIFGAFKGALIVSLFLLLESVLPPAEGLKRQESESMLFKPVRSIAPWVYNQVKIILPGAKDFYGEVKEGLEDKSKEVIDNIINDKIESVEQEVKKHIEDK